ncbi:unnamed protein product [Lupinus luteus]|uniref:Protein kinase domain-containing protein n=1 Tax=Lupinus luteus TaxID=3873 RepID=A0AAV1XFG3_LUPLU
MISRNWKSKRFNDQNGVLYLLALYVLFQCFGLCFSLNEEGKALLKLKEGIVSDPFGALSNWVDDEVAIDPCNWLGVECSDGKVVVLNLKNLCLGGSLPHELEKLVNVKSIILRNNSFYGTIPSGIVHLKELEVLDLGYNNFSGALPTDLESNISLTILLLDNNDLLGGFSPEIDKLKVFSERQVDKNSLISTDKMPACTGRSIKRYIRQNIKKRRSLLQFRILERDDIHNRATDFPDDPDPSPATSPDPPSVSPPLAPPEQIDSGSPSPLPLPGSPSPLPRPDSPSPVPMPDSPSPVPMPDSPSPVPMPDSPSPVPMPGSPSPMPMPDSPSPVPMPGSPTQSKSNSEKTNHVAILAGVGGGVVFLVISITGLYLCKTNKVATVRPWATGLSGQLQKAFVTGVPKLKRSELEAACEDFSNILGTSSIGTVYKGTLSSGIEIAVASVSMKSSNKWSKTSEIQFREKIDTLSKVNHKNFVNLLGYCGDDKPFTRMMVFEYAPNGTLFEHLHIQEAEHLNWGARLRIVTGMAYCLQHMHQLDPPLPHSNLNSSAVQLTDDYAAKISNLSILNEIGNPKKKSGAIKHIEMTLASDVYSFGVILFEIVTGRLPYSVDNNDSFEDWAWHFLQGDQPIKEMVDPTLTSFDEHQLEQVTALIESCANHDPEKRPTMKEVSMRLREITNITPEAAVPKLSPLWWAELEISALDAS